MPRTLVTGGAGFVGSHLCERLLSEDYQVICLDNLITSSLNNVSHLQGESGFRYVEHDITRPIDFSEKLDEVYHLASPASPADFERLPLEILSVGSYGTHNALELARSTGARFLLASTSEVYGDPLVHPQPEEYRGNVSTTGTRSVYDEAKRYAEAVTMAYNRYRGVETYIARIFNTYGPRMRPDDGRMIPNFVWPALAGEPLALYGDGSQTRSIQYVDDLIEGMIRLMRSRESRPVNLGNPTERTVEQIARIVLDLTGSDSAIIHEPLPEGDPKQRCPDISRARRVLMWEPVVGAEEGLRRTIEWFSSQQRVKGTSGRVVDGASSED